jgi:fermentation-respiration switch protein FrsA (DUF1100 family)
MKNFASLSRIEQHAFSGARFTYREPPSIPQSDVVWMTTSDAEGDWITGVFAPGDPDNQICVIHFYGNDENLHISRYIVDNLRAFGVSVLMFDYRGYGASRGRPREASFYSDALLIYDWLREAHPGHKVVASGWSVGSAVATYLAQHREVHGLMLFSPPTNMVECVSHIIPDDQIFIEEAMPFKFDTQERIRKVSAPILLVHGRRDAVVPYAMSEQLEKAIRSPLTRLDIPTAGHEDLFTKGGARLWEKVYHFIDALRGPDSKKLSAQSG